MFRFNVSGDIKLVGGNFTTKIAGPTIRMRIFVRIADDKGLQIFVA